jgi:prolyl-tRNA synthetase
VPGPSDRCVHCGGELRFQTAIEIGHIFKLGTRYSLPLEASFLDEDGREKPLLMGSYGIGLARVMAAAVEQRHDENGIRWPRALAPYDVHVVALPGVEEQAGEAAAQLERGGATVLLDDRDLRAGQKFADADLIGLPVRVTVGRKTLDDGMVDVRMREGGAERRIDVAELHREALEHGETA